MPSLRGLTVHVTNKEGQSLDELGEQFLRKTANGEKVSAYIKSTVRILHYMIFGEVHLDLQLLSKRAQESHLHLKRY